MNHPKTERLAGAIHAMAINENDQWEFRKPKGKCKLDSPPAGKSTLNRLGLSR